MSQILGIKFSDYGQVYYFSSGPYVVREGQQVIVKTEQGMGFGDVVQIKQAPPDGEIDDEIKPIYRLANDEDAETVKENKALAKDAFEYCRKCIKKRSLDMKLVEVEVFFDRSKMIFYFTAPGRIDFRELIKDLVREYRTRIELRQIGVRHETQMLGAIGNCGQLCCCRRFLRKFAPVTIKMAKEQNLFLNPTKISGICGRLMCCLSYEQEGYEEFNRESPKVGKRYSTAFGQAKVLRANFFKKSLSVLLEGNEEREISLDEWKEIVNKPVGSVEGAPAPKPAPKEQREPRKRPPRRDKGPSGKEAPQQRKPRRKPTREDGGEGKPAPEGKGGKAESDGKSGQPARKKRSDDGRKSRPPRRRPKRRKGRRPAKKKNEE
ncbi:PSP1 domain-containing protein [Salidesulfovibrio brasiliensis]|uniref:PSP1 domain-containing protein n=1 Tax=Salidesulfovibrio brasiliensis TaxID=221711 RepID=UPI0006CF57A5|nr:regulatory iron-sulfur-containing complex subunit RicT [Salidesulfovibrio brasiliensis]